MAKYIDLTGFKNLSGLQKMNMKFKLNKTYTIYAISIFLIEVCIALLFKDGFIRHTFGDYLVVILLYCAFKSFIEIKNIYAVLAILCISFIIEGLQLTNLLALLNLEDNTLAKLIFGTTFHASDLVAYSLGCITILIVEHYETES